MVSSGLSFFGVALGSSGLSFDCIECTCVRFMCARYYFVKALVCEQVFEIQFPCGALTSLARFPRASTL